MALWETVNFYCAKWAKGNGCVFRTNDDDFFFPFPLQALRSIAVVIISVIIGKSAFLFERGKKTNPRCSDFFLLWWCLLFIIYSCYDFTIDNKSSSDTDDSSGSEVAFAVVVVVVMLQSLFTISVLVASRKKCMLFKVVVVFFFSFP